MPQQGIYKKINYENQKRNLHFNANYGITIHFCLQ